MRRVLAMSLVVACGELPEDDNAHPRSRQQTVVTTYCEPVQEWDAAWATHEFDVLDLVNQARAAGASCGGVAFPPVPALDWNEQLRCAGRVHATDMATRRYFAHVSPEGEEPWDRMELAGYDWRYAGENIARGQRSPAEVVGDWLSSTGHCENIMGADFVDMGLGYHGDGPHWVQLFGSPL